MSMVTRKIRITRPPEEPDEASPEESPPAVEQRDQFTVSEAVPQNALYQVTSVEKDRSRLPEVAERTMARTLDGELVSRKTVDITLAVGRNRLLIFQPEDNS